MDSEDLQRWGLFRDQRSLKLTEDQKQMVVSVYYRYYKDKRKEDNRGVFRMIEKLDRVFDNTFQ